MKIAHVVDSMEVGGAETLVAQMCRLQRDQGHDPSVYAIASLGPLGEQLRREGFVIRANMARHLSDAVPTFYRAFKSAHPEVVHMHNPTPTAYASLGARLAGVRTLVSTRHGLVDAPHKMFAELKYSVAALFCDWVVGICDATVRNLTALRTVPSRKIVRVYNGVAPIQRVHSESWPPKRGFTLLFVGRLAPVKNLDLLLDAFSAALPFRPDLFLWIVGDGTERMRLERVAQELNVVDQVKFWGEQLDVAPFFSAADAFIMSSKSEGLPLSLLQAFSSGLPAIVTDVGGMAEVIRLADAGFSVPMANPAPMAEAILRLANNESERVAFARRAESAFQLSFSLAKMADIYQQLYRKGCREA